MARVLVVTSMYPPHHYGGYELSCRDVVDRWRPRGHDVTVLTSTMRVPGVADPVGERDAGVRRDLGIYWDDHRVLRPLLPQRLAMERANRRALDAALDAVQPDVVSVWQMGAMSFGLLDRLADRAPPIVYVVCDDWLVYGPEMDAWARLFLDRPRLARVASLLTGLPCALADVGTTGTFCFVSESTRDRAEQHSRWSYPDATVVYSGIDLADFPVNRKARERSWRWRLLYVGRIDLRKGLQDLVRTLAALPDDATLDIVGRGDAEHLARIQALVEELGLRSRVSFRVVERAQLHEIYAQADVLVFPSRWQEPFGLVPLEAMACGTPVVATGTGGSAEFLVDGVNCLLFPPRDEGELAAALHRLATDPHLRARLVEGGRTTAAELTVDRLADVLEEWHLAAAVGFRLGRPAHRAALARP